MKEETRAQAEKAAAEKEEKEEKEASGAQTEKTAAEKEASAAQTEKISAEKAAEGFMREALSLATKAAEAGEVPVGAVVVREGAVIGRGYNKKEMKKNALLHAEIEALCEACAYLHDWRLSDCDLYVTLEPCPMCAGAIINSRIRTLYYGASDERAGSCGTLINLFELPYNHKPNCVSGILEQESAALLVDFFKELRKKENYKKRIAREKEQGTE